MKDLSHVDSAGRARMVDVSAKAETVRTARAEGFITMTPETIAAIQQNAIDKGDVIATARIAGIMAAKRTPDLIPLCHPLLLTDVGVEIEPTSGSQIRVTAWATTTGRTGAEMEALTAVSVALLTIYDMAKALDRSMRISEVCLTEKHGGRTGSWKRE